MRTSQAILILVAGFTFLGCGKKDGPTEYKSSTSGGNPVTAPVDYLGAVSKAKKNAEKTIDTVGLKQAIQAFYVTEGRYPKNLNELVGPSGLSSLPKPPAGMKFNYNPANGDIKVVPQ